MQGSDSEFQRELAQIRAQLEIESAAQDASDKMKMRELFSAARERGPEYSSGFEDGWGKCAQMLMANMSTFGRAAVEKHSALNRKIGLPDL